MTVGWSKEDFAGWVEPHLTVLARYAARRVGPSERDEAVAAGLAGAWQHWSSYDEARSNADAWLLEILADRCRRHRPRRVTASVVDLVDDSVAPPSDDVALEQAIEQLDDTARQAVDLHHFVGLDVATTAEVLHCEPGEVTAALTGDDADRAASRIRDLARRWQHEQPPPSEVPTERLDSLRRRRLRRRPRLAAAAAVVLVGVGVAVLVRGQGGDPAPTRDLAAPARAVHRAKETVPWRDLEPRNPVFGDEVNGALVTPYDDVEATGTLTGTVHPGDTFVFDAVLTSPGIVSLHPCPDYTIAFGSHTVTRRLNCGQVPYLASLVRSDGGVTTFRPVLPAGTSVFFRMAVVVPDDLGRQEVSWTLEGPTRTPQFTGVVDVTDPDQG
jgi:DNA-directed RNA polymerase specialized sigma24 family protein